MTMNVPHNKKNKKDDVFADISYICTKIQAIHYFYAKKGSLSM